jgi:hypothetical protein
MTEECRAATEDGRVEPARKYSRSRKTEVLLRVVQDELCKMELSKMSPEGPLAPLASMDVHGVLICGYKRSGKTTLAAYMQCADVGVGEHRPQYTVLAAPGTVTPPWIRRPVEFGHSFAELLYEWINGEYADELQSCLKRYKTFDDFKDVPVSELYGYSFRTLLLDRGEAMRAENPNVFAEDVLNRAARHGRPFVVSDLRFENELECMRQALPAALCSVRLYFSGALVPAPDHRAEHDLDQLRTDYVIIRRGDQEQQRRERELLVAQFPQYSNFVAQWDY